MKTTQRQVADLLQDPANVRAHDGRNIDAIKASLRRFGQQKPIVVNPDGMVVAGNGTLAAAHALDWEQVSVVVTGLEGAEATAYAIADNRTAELAAWDEDALGQTLAALQADESIDELVTGFSEQEIAALVGKTTGEVEEDEVPEPPADPVTKPGDLWLLGDHRVLCGDSTNAEDVGLLLGGEVATMLHADPPYGMGKESEGIANDNLYREKLDAFQMAWWTAWRSSLTDNGSAYVWGNAEDLWRLWFQGGLGEDADLTLRNEIVWDKAHGQGMGSEAMHSFVTASERCMFFMRGQQFIGNQNACDYWDGYEPLRAWMVEQMETMGWKLRDINRITGTQMASHWFTTSQFQPIRVEHYAKLQEAAGGKAFTIPYDRLFGELFGGVLSRTRDLGVAMRESRSFFDSTHDHTMTDVWSFPRVLGEDRHGHATPKPVKAVARAIKSSSQAGDCVGVPFAGTCPEIVACDQLDRKCYGMEIEPAYCDVIVARWENLTGGKAVLEEAVHA